MDINFLKEKFDSLEWKYCELNKKYKDLKEKSDLNENFLAHYFGDEYHSFAFRNANGVFQPRSFTKMPIPVNVNNVNVNSSSAHLNPAAAVTSLALGNNDLEGAKVKSVETSSSGLDRFQCASVQIKTEEPEPDQPIVITIDDDGKTLNTPETEVVENVNVNFEKIEVKTKAKKGRKGSSKKTVVVVASTECVECGMVLDNNDHLQEHMNTAHVRYPQPQVGTNKNGTKKRSADPSSSLSYEEEEEAKQEEVEESKMKKLKQLHKNDIADTGDVAVTDTDTGTNFDALPSTLKELEQRSYTRGPRGMQTARKPYAKESGPIFVFDRPATRRQFAKKPYASNRPLN